MINVVKAGPKKGMTKGRLVKETHSHIKDVQSGMNFLADAMKEQSAIHDHTKLETLDDFYDALTGDDMDNSAWYKMHVTKERHHLLKHVPEDVTLIDVMEYITDCTMAGLARSGSVYEITLPPDVMQQAINNTVELLKKNARLVDTKEYKDTDNILDDTID